MSDLNGPVIENIDLEDVRRLLWGKSHFFDRDTMRSFGTRLLCAHRAGQSLLTRHRDKHPTKGLVYSVTSFDLKTGGDTRVVRFDSSTSRVERIFKAEWEKIMQDVKSGAKKENQA